MKTLGGSRLKRTLFAAVLLGLYSAGLARAEVILAVSRFDGTETPKDGWTGVENLEGNPRSVAVYHNATNGVAGGGCVGMIEKSGDGTTMYFVAPANFHGHGLLAYGGALEFDLRQFATSDLGLGYIAYLRAGTNEVGYMPGRIPSTNWTHHVLRLDENVGWINLASRERATRAEMLKVLAGLDRILIRSEYSGGNYDETQLDNVVLTAGQPELHIEPIEPGRIEVSWEARWDQFRLETAPRASPEAWQRETQTVFERSGSRFTILDGSGDEWLFRLVAP